MSNYPWRCRKFGHEHDDYSTSTEEVFFSEQCRRHFWGFGSRCPHYESGEGITDRPQPGNYIVRPKYEYTEAEKDIRLDELKRLRPLFLRPYLYGGAEGILWFLDDRIKEIETGKSEIVELK